MPPRRSNNNHSSASGTAGGSNNVDSAALMQLIQTLTQQNATLAQQQQQTQQQLAVLMQQQQQQPPPPPPHQAPVVTFKTFQAVKPPEFKGVVDPVEAEAWLKEMEKAFALVQVPENKKTEYACYFLKGEANYWWETVKGIEAAEFVLWERFRELFTVKYAPSYLKDQMEVKFLELKQGNMSVTEYEAKFTELSRFAPGYVGTEKLKARRFQQGLKPWIRSKLAILKLETYAEIVERAMVAEGESELYQKEREEKKRKGGSSEGKTAQGQGHSQNFSNKKQKSGGKKNFGFRKLGTVGQNQGNRLQPTGQPRIERPPLPDCKTCGKKHTGICHRLSVTCYKCQQKGHYALECKAAINCFKCGKTGHMARDCKAPLPKAPVIAHPMIRAAEAPLALPYASGSEIQPVARTFNMTMNEAVKDTEVVAGTLPVNSVSAKVLIDSGATKSFISREFASRLNCEMHALDEPMTIEIANSERIPVDQVCLNCEIDIAGKCFYANLIPFQLGEFDVILGMDWLGNNEAQIDCKNKKVVLKSPESGEVIFRGQKQVRKFLTMIQTKRLMRQGCESYLAYVLDTRKEEPRAKQIDDQE